MYKSWKRITAALLSVLLCMHGIVSPVFAEGTELPEETVTPEETPAAEGTGESEAPAEEVKPEETAEAPEEAAEEPAPQEDAEEGSVPMASETDPEYYELNVRFLADGLDPEDEISEFVMKIYDETGEYEECAGSVYETGNVFDHEITITENGEHDYYFAVDPAPGYKLCSTVYRIHLNVTDEGIVEKTIYRGNAETEEQILDNSIYTESIASEDDMTFEFLKVDLPEFTPRATVLLDNGDPKEDGVYTFEIKNEETEEQLMTASNTGRDVIFSEPIVLEEEGTGLYTISQIDDGDGTETLDNSVYTFEFTAEWNDEERVYDQSLRLLNEAGQEATVEEENVPCFYNFSEETISLDTPLTVRVESEDAELLNREYEIEFKGIDTDRTVTKKTTDRVTEYGFDAFVTPGFYTYEISLKTEDGIVVEEPLYVYEIEVGLDSITEEMVIDGTQLKYNDEAVDEAVFHVSKDGGDTPDPEDDLIREIEQKKQEYEAALADLETAEQELSNAESALSIAEGELNAAKADAAAKASAVTEAQAALDAKDAEIAKKTKEYNDAVAAKETAQAEYDDAQAAYQALIDAQGGSDLEALEAQKAEAEKAVAAAQNQIDKGSLGYFESRNADHAVLILNYAIAHPTADNGSEAGKTIIGDPDDATSLENMLNTFQYIREGNTLRHTDEHRQKNHDGCPDDLAVSHEMMALAQVNTNMAAAIHNHWHGLKVNGLQFYGENAAFGYKNESPFRGWYDKEKAIYDSNGSGVTGHYKNIVNPDNDPDYYQYVATGFGINTRSTITHGQDFCMDYYLGTLEGTSIDGRTNACSVDEYETDFKAYYKEVHDNLNTAKEKLAEIEEQIKKIEGDSAAIKAARKKVEEKKQALDAAEAAEAAAKSAMEAEQAEREALVTNLQNAQQEKDAADEAVAEKQTAYDAAKDVRDAAQAKVNAAQTVVDEKLAAYNEAKSKLISVTDIQIESDSITMHYNEKGTLTATVVPEDAYYKGVKWESLNPEIVEITETGRYHALTEGDAVLTVRPNEPGSEISKTVSVHVNAPAINGFKEIPDQTVESGEEPEYPETVTATYEDGTEKEVPVVWEELDEEQYGAIAGGKYDVEGTVEGTTLRPSFTVTVNPAEVVEYTGPKEFSLRVDGDLESILPENGNFLYSNGDTTYTTIEYPDLEDADVSVPGDLEIDAVIFEGTEDAFWFTLTVHVYEAVIETFDRPETITVESGTEPVYPDTVHAHYDDGLEADLEVVWDELTEEQYSIRTGETYTVTGTVEETHLTPELTVIVKPAGIKSIEEFETIRTRVKTAPELPETAEVTWTNDEVSDEEITWNKIPEKSYAKAGTFKATGYILNAKGEKVNVNVMIEVYEPKIESFDAIDSQTIESGNQPVYPETVTAHFDDGVTETLTVDWNKLTREQYAAREGGEFTVTGKVEGSDKKPEFKVTVKPAEVSWYVGFGTIKTREGVYPVLPETVELHWSNEDVTTAPVTWDVIPEELYAKAGEFTVSGQAKASETMNEPVSADIEVYEAKIIEVKTPDTITVPSGTEPEYPATVHVYYNDNGEGDVPVTWERQLTRDEYSVRAGAEYTINGSVKDYYKGTELRIVVEAAEIKSIKEPEAIRTRVKTAPVLPEKTEVTWTNGDVSEETVYWNEIPEKSYAKAGTFTAKGYVKDLKDKEVPVSVQITAYEPKIESYDAIDTQTIDSGAQPVYPETVTAHFDDGITEEVPVEWQKLTNAQYGLRKGGEFTVTGTVKGTDKKPEFTVIVKPAEPKGFEDGEYYFNDGLKITTGRKPIEVLPAEIRVEWTNGDVTDERVTWNKEASDTVAEPGGVYVYGKITVSDGREYNVRTHVAVTKAGNYHTDPGDVTEEDAKQVNYNIPEGLWAAGIPNDLVYNGTAQTFDFRVYNGNTLLVNKKDYTFKYSNNKNAGVHDLEDGADLNWKPANKEKKPYITITGKGNYSGKIYVPFDIQPVTEELTTVPSITVKYNKKVQKPSPAVMYNRTVLKKGTDYTLTYFDLALNEETTAPKEPGSYVIHVRGIGNYAESSADIPMIIEEAPKLASGFNVKVPNVKYESIQDKEKGLTVEELKDLITVTYGKNKEAVTYGTDYELEVVNAKSVGKATLYVKGIEGYTGTKTVTFSITGVPIKNATSLIVTSQPYTGEQIKPAELTNSNLIEGTDYELIYTNNINAGKATVTLKGIGNYTGSIKKTFTIRPTAFDATFSVSAEDTVYVKGGAKPAVTVMHDGVKLSQGTDYTVKYSGNKKPGEGTVTVTGKGNYKGTLSAKFRIDFANLANARVTAPDKVSAAKMYSAVTLTDTNGTKLKAGTDYIKPSNRSYTYVNDTVLTNGEIRKAGYPVQPKDIAPADTWIRVTVIGKGNYTGSAVGEFRILAKSHDLSKATVQFVKDGATVKSLTKEYTGLPVTLEKSELAVKAGGVALGEDDYDIIGYTNNVKKGTATVTIAGRGEYGGTKTVKFKIGAEKLTVWEALTGLFGN